MKLFSLLLLLLTQVSYAQNVGIGTNTPRGPLSFPPTAGQKIILWDDGNAGGGNYGIGVQSGLLQIHTYQNTDDIVLGVGSSENFVERMRVKGNGFVGIGVNDPGFHLDIANRMRVRSGGDIFNTAGIWFNRTNNSSEQMFFGVQDDTWVGIYGSSPGFSFGMNTTNGDVKVMGRLGIGTTTPNAPLSFPPSLGKKITLYPGGTGDVGLSVQGNLLQIYSDNPNADIAFGYDQAGTMTERFRVRANGALRLNGDAGGAGKVIQSNGDGAPANWVSSTNTLFNNTIEIYSGTTIELPSSGTNTDLPGMFYNYTTAGNAKVLINYSVTAKTIGCAFCGNTQINLELVSDGNLVQIRINDVGNDVMQTISGTKILNVGPGNHTLKLRGRPAGNTSRFGDWGNFMTVQVIPQ